MPGTNALAYFGLFVGDEEENSFCTIDASSPRQSFRRASVGVTSPSSGVAPIATQEHLDEEDLEEVDNADSKSNDNAVDGKI